MCVLASLNIVQFSWVSEVKTWLGGLVRFGLVQTQLMTIMNT